MAELISLWSGSNFGTLVKLQRYPRSARGTCKIFVCLELKKKGCIFQMFSIITFILTEKDFYQPVERSHVEEKINKYEELFIHFISAFPCH